MGHPEDKALTGLTRLLRPDFVASLAVALLCLMLTFISMVWTSIKVREDAQERFERHVASLEGNVATRFDRLLYGLEGLRSYFDAVDGHVSREPFQAWANSRKVSEVFPGIRGFGFIERVERQGLDFWTAGVRADYSPDFKVKTSGSATDLYVIKFIQPLANNAQAWGYDVGSEAVRREAIERAIDSGKPALTGRIALVQDGRKRPGYLYFLPVYKSAMALTTPEQRRAALLGVVYAPIVIEEFLHDVADVSDGLLNVVLFDGSADDPAEQVFAITPPASDGATEWLSGAKLVVRRVLQVGGRELLLRADPTPKFRKGVEYMTPVWVGLFGLVLSILLAVVIYLLAVGRARAEALAQRMTADLQDAKLRAESALRDSKALLDTLNRFSLVSVVDWSGTIIEVNDAFCTLSGYSRDELIGQNHRIVNSGRQDAAFWDAMWQQIASGAPWSGEICNRAKDGRLYWVHSIIAPFMGPDGHIEKYVSIRTDITARKHAEQELRDRAERYTLAIEGGNDGIWDWVNLHDQAEWWSPQCYRLLGYEPNEFTADLLTFDRLLHPAHHAANLAALEAALKNATPYDIEYPLQTKSGEYRWFRVRAKVFFDEAGQPYRMAGSLQDVHDRRVAQEALKEHGERLAAVLSLSPDGFASFGIDGCVGYISPAFTSLTGLSASDVVGLDEARFLTLLLNQSTCSAVVGSFDALRANSSADLATGVRRQGPDSMVLEMKLPQRRVLELRLRMGQGSAVRQVLHLHDITKESEVDRMKSAFLSVAAHELRTPMSSIYGFTELLLSRDFKPDKQRDLLGRIHRQSEAMINILNELLDLARLDARRDQDFEAVTLDLTEVVAEVLRDFNLPGGREAPQVESRGRAMPVMADRAKLCQAVLNVLSNAYKYSPQGGAVRVRFEQSGTAQDGLQFGVRVIDQGIGMSAEQLAHVGERFYRADKSGNIPGTGLGISIVTEVIQLMGGRIELQSAPGKGTDVVLWLPASKQLSEIGADTEAAPLLDLA